MSVLPPSPSQSTQLRPSTISELAERTNPAPFFDILLYIAKLFTSKSSCVPHHVRRQRRLAASYGSGIAALTLLCLVAPVGPAMKAFVLGLMVPGLGFLQWAVGDQVLLACGLFVAGLGLFGFALLLWFATGNLIAPIATWVLLAMAAARPNLVGLDGGLVAAGWQFALVPVLAGVLGAMAARKVKPSLPISLIEVAADADLKATALFPASGSSSPDELSLEDLQRLRLLLDRALQPVERFDGFEWRDQFQTAAVRYQVNFMAYALGLARANFAPAADAYFVDAQQRLQTKLGDHRLWSYWRFENAWGNFRLDADPIRDENIMYPGFAALQMAIGGSDSDLVLRRKGKPWRCYGLNDIATLLARQYAAAPYGLLACEPNWIYPLCNLITMAGLRAADARAGTEHWPQLAARFLQSLDREGRAADGSFIALRSALTGIAPPAWGGIVMQSFPCLFLNALVPELAREHWARVRKRLDTENWRRLFWPIDVGNYGFSRAAGYAATTAAAVEFGDQYVARECLSRLEDECGSRSDQGVIHRDRASLWAHALELFARCNRPNGFRDLVQNPPANRGPRLISAPYPDVLVAKAKADGERLTLVLYSDRGDRVPSLELAGLLPDRRYNTGHPDQPVLKADCAGRATIEVSLERRTVFDLHPII